MTTTQTGISVIWQARAKPGRAGEVRELITRLVTPSRHDVGNVDYEAHEVEGQPGTCVIYERWVSRDALELHMRSPWIPDLTPPLLELIEGDIEDELRILRTLRPTPTISATDSSSVAPSPPS